MDKDGNGYVDRDELMMLLSKHGYLSKDKVEEEIDEIFNTTDSNKDGKIDFV